MRARAHSNCSIVLISCRANVRLQPRRLSIAPVAVGCKPMLGSPPRAEGRIYRSAQVGKVDLSREGAQ